MAIIALSGKISSGKDLTGKIIQYLTDKSEMGYTHPDGFNDYISYLNNNHNSKSDWKIKKFADKLKECVSLITGIPRIDLEKIEVKNRVLGEEWIRYAKADGFFMKNGERIMNSEPCSKEEYEEELKTNWQTAYKLKHTPRTILQMLGTEVGRFIHPNLWINSLFVDYKEYTYQEGVDNSNPQFNIIDGNKPFLKKYPNWIITDMRFLNELKAVENRKGITIRINRSVCPKCNEQENIHFDTITNIVQYCNECGYEWSTHTSETALDNSDFHHTIDNNGTIEELIEKVKLILQKEKII